MLDVPRGLISALSSLFIQTLTMKDSTHAPAGRPPGIQSRPGCSSTQWLQRLQLHA